MATLTLKNKKRASNPTTSNNDDYISPTMLAKIELAMQQYKRGEGVLCKTYEDSMRYFAAL